MVILLDIRVTFSTDVFYRSVNFIILLLFILFNLYYLFYFNFLFLFLSKLQIWDTAGMEQFRKGLITQYYRNVDGAIFVYDITRRETFVSIDEWLKEMKTYSRNSERIKMILIGNQNDQSNERDVTTDEGQLYANEHGMIFTEISAKHQESLSKLDSVILRLSEQMLAAREENSLTRSMHKVIRLNDVTVEDGWIVVNEIPEGPFLDYVNNPRQSKRDNCQC